MIVIFSQHNKYVKQSSTRLEFPLFKFNYSINPNDLSYCKLQIHFILFHYACKFWNLNSYYGSQNEVFRQYSDEYFNQTNFKRSHGFPEIVMQYSGEYFNL